MGEKRIHSTMIRKTEWERLKKQASDSANENQTNHEATDDVKASIKISQKWIRSWPDTAEGIVAQALKRKAQKTGHQEINNWRANLAQHRQEIEANKKAAVRNARQMIFEDSSYGRQLLSALYHSQTIEDWDSQIKFKNQLKQKAVEFEKEKEMAEMVTDIFQLDKKETRDKHKIKVKNLEYAEDNRTAANIKSETIAKLRDLEKIGELEDARLMNKLLVDEAKEAKKVGHLKKQFLEQNLRERKKRSDDQTRLEVIDDRIVAVWRNYYDKLRRNTKDMMNQIHMEKHNTAQNKRCYEITKQLQEIEQKRYDEFIAKGIQRSEQIAEERDQQAKENQKLNKEQLSATPKVHKMAAGNYSDGSIEVDRNKCLCWKQSLCIKSRSRDNKKKSTVDEIETKPHRSFVGRSSKLREDEEVSSRAHEPSPYSGTRAAHAYYAQQASAILAECTHKGMALKVIEEYRKDNNLDSASWPSPTK